MKVYYGLDEFNKVGKIVATIGTFDGVHIGHKKLLKNLVAHGKICQAESLLLTFFPHPRMVLFPESNDLKLLNSQDEKIELLSNLGIDHLIIEPFTREFSRLTSTEFVRDVLINTIGVQRLVIGYDHHFGRNREGSFGSLSELSSLYNFELEEIGAKVLDDINISSTKIRKALTDGNIDIANEYLSYNFQISGTVIEGNKLGRTIGFPTANIKPIDKYKLIPGLGVYAVRVTVNKTILFGMLNLGNRPTVENTENTTIEVHIFDFNKDIYDQYVTVQLLTRFRDEYKFESVFDLKEQLNKDEVSIRDYFISGL